MTVVAVTAVMQSTVETTKTATIAPGNLIRRLFLNLAIIVGPSYLELKIDIASWDTIFHVA